MGFIWVISNTSDILSVVNKHFLLFHNNYAYLSYFLPVKMASVVCLSKLPKSVRVPNDNLSVGNLRNGISKPALNSFVLMASLGNWILSLDIQMDHSCTGHG